MQLCRDLRLFSSDYVCPFLSFFTYVSAVYADTFSLLEWNRKEEEARV